MVLFSLVLFSNAFLSTATLINSEFSCPIPSLKNQLCKSFETEPRPRYWQWAISIIKEHPWIGSGPGTFGVEAKKQRLAFYNSTGYLFSLLI